MKKTLVRVTFLQHAGIFIPGDVAGVDPEWAAQLVERGSAVYADPPRAKEPLPGPKDKGKKGALDQPGADAALKGAPKVG